MFLHRTVLMMGTSIGCTSSIRKAAWSTWSRRHAPASIAIMGNLGAVFRSDVTAANMARLYLGLQGVPKEAKAYTAWPSMCEGKSNHLYNQDIS